MREENEEYLEATNQGDLVEVADTGGYTLYSVERLLNTYRKSLKVFEEIQQ